nr:uncharacterized protein LOC109149920 [Ipomoea batatas]
MKAAKRAAVMMQPTVHLKTFRLTIMHPRSTYFFFFCSVGPSSQLCCVSSSDRDSAARSSSCKFRLRSSSVAESALISSGPPHGSLPYILGIRFPIPIKNAKCGSGQRRSASLDAKFTPSRKQKAKRKKLEEISSELSASRESRKPGRGGVSGAVSAGRWNHDGWANGKSPLEEAREREARTACPTTELWHRNRRSLNVWWNYGSPFKIFASKMNSDLHHACDFVLPSLSEACTSFRKWRNAGSNGADGTNYHTWSRAMKVALVSKNKLDFVDDSVMAPKRTNANYITCKRENNMVLSWPLHFVIPVIAQSILWLDTAKEGMHTVDKCYKLHRYPSGWKGKNKQSSVHSSTQKLANLVAANSMPVTYVSCQDILSPISQPTSHIPREQLNIPLDDKLPSTVAAGDIKRRANASFTSFKSNVQDVQGGVEENSMCGGISSSLDNALFLGNFSSPKGSYSLSPECQQIGDHFGVKNSTSSYMSSNGQDDMIPYGSSSPAHDGEPTHDGEPADDGGPMCSDDSHSQSLVQPHNAEVVPTLRRAWYTTLYFQGGCL